MKARNNAIPSDSTITKVWCVSWIRNITTQNAIALQLTHMKEVRLTDLDELALTARDRVARSYILEAIDAYRVGAYRASIVSTWIAVTFDIIAKIRELSIQGDSMAQDFIKTLDQAIVDKNIKKLQSIEEDLLKKATSDFEFLSAQEQIDLDRLKDDRNLCAHPAFVGEELLFEPEPERVRMHIVHVVKHLLQHQPIQGKSAIERIVRDIKSESFPPTLALACDFLNSRYLNRAKKSLIENLIFLLLKSILRGDMPDLPVTHLEPMTLTLQAVSKKYPDIYERRVKEKISTLSKFLEKDQLPNFFQLLGVDSRCWQWLDEQTRIYLKALIQSNFNQSNIRFHIIKAIAVEDLKPFIFEAFRSFSQARQIRIIQSNPHQDFVDYAIDIYASASSYYRAEELGKSLIIPMASYFSSRNVEKLLETVQGNSQIYYAGGTPAIFEEFFEKTKHHLPYLHKSWIDFLSFWLSETYDGKLIEETSLDFWSTRRWGGLVNRLNQAGVNIPLTKESDD